MKNGYLYHVLSVRPLTTIFFALELDVINFLQSVAGYLVKIITLLYFKSQNVFPKKSKDGIFSFLLADAEFTLIVREEC